MYKFLIVMLMAFAAAMVAVFTTATTEGSATGIDAHPDDEGPLDAIDNDIREPGSAIDGARSEIENCDVDNDENVNDQHHGDAITSALVT